MPHLQYQILAWGFDSSRIFKLQKRAVRTVAKAKFIAHTEPIFKDLKFLKLSDLYEIFVLKFYHKFINDLLPSYFRDMPFVRFNTFSEHFTRGSANDEMEIPRTELTFAQKTIRYTTVKIISSLPVDISKKLSKHSRKNISDHFMAWKIEEYKIDCILVDCYTCNNA